MKKICLLFLSLALFSYQCEQQRASEQKQEGDDINTIIMEVVIQDSLDVKIPIAEEIKSFVYFPYQTYEGMEIPPPPNNSGIHHVNEFIISRNFEFIKKYQLTKFDTLHIKEQLLHPIQVSLGKQEIPHLDIFSIEAAKTTGGRKVDKCYMFSTPLFSSDSTIVYVQYDYLPVDVSGYGSFTVLQKQQDKWIKIGDGPTWMH